MKLPRSVPGWTVAVFGAMALVLGVVGLVVPDVLLTLLGFELLSPAERSPGDHTRTFMAASSMASLNMGVYYLVAAATDWQPFFSFSALFRLLTFTVFTLLVVFDVAPTRFLGVAVWEGFGGLVTAVAIRRDRRRSGVRAVRVSDGVQ